MKSVFTSRQCAQEVDSPFAAMETNAGSHGVFLEVFPQSNRSYQELVLDAVDETFSALGKTAKQVIYFHLEKTFNICKQEIPCKTEKFTKAIEEIIGPGAKLLEIEIIEKLYKKIGQNFKYHPKQKDLTFTEYLKAVYTFLNITNRLNKLT
ncbi:MAG: hypothetical protein ABSG57_12850 [Candidatus Bathyarchaeia archaeon]